MIGWFKKSVSGALGIELSPFGVAIAHLGDEYQEGLQKADCHYFEGSLEACRADLEQWVCDRDLQNIQAHIVLHPSLYTLYFVDRPDVEDADLSNAVRWKIKDLIDGPVKDLVVDAFALPPDAYRGNQKKVYVVAMQRQMLEGLVDLLKTLSIEICDIGISELADRAMLNRMQDDLGGAALLRLRSASGTINLIDGGDLYLTRSIDSGVSVLESATEQSRDQVLDELLLEVQRCVDFYDSQLGKGAIRKVLVAPTRLDRNFFDEHLRDHLGMTVHPLDLNETFAFNEPISGDLQSTCFAAVAAATASRGA